MKAAPKMQTEAAAPDDGDMVDLLRDPLALEMGRCGWDGDAKGGAALAHWPLRVSSRCRGEDGKCHLLSMSHLLRQSEQELGASAERTAASWEKRDDWRGGDTQSEISSRKGLTLPRSDMAPVGACFDGVDPSESRKTGLARRRPISDGHEDR